MRVLTRCCWTGDWGGGGAACVGGCCCGAGRMTAGARACRAGVAIAVAPCDGPHPDTERASAKMGMQRARLPGRIAIMRIKWRCDNTTPKRGRYYADDKLSHGDIAHFIVLPQ